jgi:hypothetical protein
MAIRLEKDDLASQATYFLDHGNGRTEGPLSASDALLRLQTAADPNMMVWKEGHDWREAWRYGEFSGLFQTAPLVGSSNAKATADEVTDPRPGMFRTPFSFNGRIRRAEYALSVVVAYISYAALFFASGGKGLFFGIGAILIFWAFLAQGAKRCHDRGNSGWFQCIPFYGLWMLLAGGDTGMNIYGPSPK